MAHCKQLSRSGIAEKAVQTIKQLLKKAIKNGEDPYLAVQAHRAWYHLIQMVSHHLQNDYSEEELELACNLSTPRPT